MEDSPPSLELTIHFIHAAKCFLFLCKFQCQWNTDWGLYQLCVRTGLVQMLVLSREPGEELAHTTVQFLMHTWWTSLATAFSAGKDSVLTGVEIFWL